MKKALVLLALALPAQQLLALDLSAMSDKVEQDVATCELPGFASTVDIYNEYLREDGVEPTKLIISPRDLFTLPTAVLAKLSASTFNADTCETVEVKNGVAASRLPVDFNEYWPALRSVVSNHPAETARLKRSFLFNPISALQARDISLMYVATSHGATVAKNLGITLPECGLAPNEARSGLLWIEVAVALGATVAPRTSKFEQNHIQTDEYFDGLDKYRSAPAMNTELSKPQKKGGDAAAVQRSDFAHTFFNCEIAETKGGRRLVYNNLAQWKINNALAKAGADFRFREQGAGKNFALPAGKRPALATPAAFKASLK